MHNNNAVFCGRGKMKLWLEWGPQFEDNIYIFLGVGGYWHCKDHNWKGLTLLCYLPFNRLLQLNWVSNWEAYDLRINQRKRRNDK